MKRTLASCLVVLLLAALASAGRGKRDPLAPAEIDELRETAQEPEKRLQAFVRFIRTRSTTLEQLRSDPRIIPDRLAQIHDLLEDITTLIDEMDENIDTYVSRKADLRKPLKQIIDLNGEVQAKLQMLKQRGVASQPGNAKEYEFALENATEAVAGSLDSARTTMREQEEQFKAEKEAKKKK